MNDQTKQGLKSAVVLVSVFALVYVSLTYSISIEKTGLDGESDMNSFQRVVHSGADALIENGNPWETYCGQSLHSHEGVSKDCFVRGTSYESGNATLWHVVCRFDDVQQMKSFRRDDLAKGQFLSDYGSEVVPQYCSITQEIGTNQTTIDES